MKHNTLFNLVKSMAFAVLLGMVVYGCNPKEPEIEMAPPEQEVSLDGFPGEEIVYGAEDEDVIVQSPMEEVVFEDVPVVKESFKEMIESGKYKADLYEDLH